MSQKQPIEHTIDEWPDKKLIVTDLIRLMDHKEIVQIVEVHSNSDNKSLYKGRVENLNFTETGYSDELCWRYVVWFERVTDAIMIYVGNSDERVKTGWKEIY